MRTDGVVTSVSSSTGAHSIKATLTRAGALLKKIRETFLSPYYLSRIIPTRYTDPNGLELKVEGEEKEYLKKLAKASHLQVCDRQDFWSGDNKERAGVPVLLSPVLLAYNNAYNFEWVLPRISMLDWHPS